MSRNYLDKLRRVAALSRSRSSHDDGMAKPGRPKRTVPRQVVSTYVDTPDAEAFERICDAQGTTRTEVLRTLLSEYVNTHADVVTQDPQSDQERLIAS